MPSIIAATNCAMLTWRGREGSRGGVSAPKTM